jgi:hypothetical protein
VAGSSSLLVLFVSRQRHRSGVTTSQTIEFTTKTYSLHPNNTPSVLQPDIISHRCLITTSLLAFVGSAAQPPTNTFPFDSCLATTKSVTVVGFERHPSGFNDLLFVLFQCLGFIQFTPSSRGTPGIHLPSDHATLVYHLPPLLLSPIRAFANVVDAMVFLLV